MYTTEIAALIVAWGFMAWRGIRAAGRWSPRARVAELPVELSSTLLVTAVGAFVIVNDIWSEGLGQSYFTEWWWKYVFAAPLGVMTFIYGSRPGRESPPPRTADGC